MATLDLLAKVTLPALGGQNSMGRGKKPDLSSFYKVVQDLCHLLGVI